MYHIEPVEDESHDGPRPYRVMVNKTFLRDARGSERRFKDSFTAALAGAKYVDEMKALVAKHVNGPARHE